MKIIWLCILSLLLTGCDNSALKNENNKLKSEVEYLKSENDELKNGVDRLYSEIKTQYANKNYKEVVTLFERLRSKHPGCVQVDNSNAMYKDAIRFINEDKIRKEKEDKQKKQDAYKAEQNKYKDIIRVSKCYPSRPNSAGGVDLHIVWQNRSKYTIKYISFVVVPYNAVDDIVSSVIGHTSLYRGEVTGPIKAGQWHGENSYWECAWYNNTIKRVKLVSVDIEYMDGRKISIGVEETKYIQY